MSSHDRQVALGLECPPMHRQGHSVALQSRPNQHPDCLRRTPQCDPDSAETKTGLMCIQCNAVIKRDALFEEEEFPP